MRRRRLLITACLLPIALVHGCAADRDGGAGRFATGLAAPCALFPDALFDPRRPPVACPWPAAGAETDRLPCAIEHFIGDETSPRAVRRLAYDAHGRLKRFSDHRGDTVAEARVITYGVEGDTLVVNDFARVCGDPTPRHLFARSYTFDADARLTGWHSAGRRAAVTYDYVRRPFRVEATATVTGVGKPRWWQFDRHGHVAAVGLGRTPGARVDTRTELHHRGEVLQDFLRRGGDGAIQLSGTFTHDRQGRPTSLSLRAPDAPPQRYAFRYDCDAAPSCAPHPPQGRVHHATRTAMSLDPELRHFAARDCSDHFAHSGSTCGTLLRWGAGFSMTCCKTSADEIQIRSDSPLTRGRVDGMALEGPDGTRVDSSYCAKAENTPQPPWACRFPRSQLLDVAGEGTLKVLGRDGQLIHDGKLDLDAVARAAR